MDAAYDHYQEELLRRLPQLDCTGYYGYRDGLLHIFHGDAPFCRQTPEGFLRFYEDQFEALSQTELYDKIHQEVRAIREYVSLYEAAPQMEAEGVHDYRKLAEYGNIVLAGTYSENHGFMFTTWDQDKERGYVSGGDYHICSSTSGRRWKSAGAILGSGFSVAWRVLDAQYWGVPQRRKRIFLVADFGGTSAPEILFKQESLPGYSAEISRTGQGASGETQKSTGDPSGDQIGQERFMAFHINQREETINLGHVSGALMATRNMQMQTFIAGFSDQQKEPTLCLNDQGGQVMDCSVDVAGTLRAQMSGHPPLVFDNHGQDLRFTGPVEKAQAVTASYGMGGNTQSLVLFENHGIDGRYTGPLPVSPTLSARSGTGGNNLPLIAEEPDSYCIAGNIIDRQSKNGGNGFGYQEDISYTLNTTDRHAVYSRQRVDEFQESKVAGTESARQYKDATDLICQPEVNRNLIRRLTPLECERLQGFPDGWTLIDGASDSARYKALGNSVAIPCVTFVLRGIVLIMEKEFAEEQKN